MAYGNERNGGMRQSAWQQYQQRRSASMLNVISVIAAAATSIIEK